MHLQLSDSFALYKKEKAENDRMLNETNERLQKQLTDLRSSHAKLTSQLEFSSKRLAQSGTTAFKKKVSQRLNHEPLGELFLTPRRLVFFPFSVRYEMLQDNVSAYRREICALQERNQKLSATAQQHEHVIHTMSQDLRQANEKLALEEVRRSLIICRVKSHVDKSWI